jgi:hypothetical protein
MENGNGIGIFDVTRKSFVAVPTLLHHDTNENVLVMTDLGSVPSMLDFFSGEIGGYTLLTNVAAQSRITEQYNLNITGGRESELESFFIQLGSQFGHFLALLHSPNTLKVIRSRFGSNSKFPYDPSLGKAIDAWTVTRLKVRLELFSSLLAEFNVAAEELEDRAVTNTSRDTIEEERALTHGDAWPTAMLAVPPLQKNNLPLSAGFIDWEYARIWRGVSSDFAITAAHYAVMEIAAAFTSERMRGIAPTNTLSYLMKFRCTMVSQYRVVSSQEGALWQPTFTNGDIPEVTDLKALIFRSTMIAHGAEIVQVAMSRRWRCGHTQCSLEGSELEPRKGQCELVQRIVRYGIWYLCHAGASLSEFCSRDNWEKLQIGQRQGFWLLDLFL